MERSQAIPESLYRTLVDELDSYAVILVDESGIVQHWNRGAEQVFGWRSSETLGRSAEIIFTPEDVAAGVMREELRLAATNGKADDRRWQKRRDGSRVFVDGVVIALGDDSDVRMFAKIARDATAEQSSRDASNATETQLSLIINSIRDYAIYMLGADGTILTWSRGAQRIKGYTAQEVIGRNFAIFYPPEDVATGKPLRQLQIAAERGTYEDESTHVRKDGSRFWASVVVSAVRNESGRVTGFVNLTHDITDRKRNRERLELIAEASRLLSSSINFEETLRQIARIAVPRLGDWCILDLLTDHEPTLSRAIVEHVDPAKVALAQELQRKYPPSTSDRGMGDAIRERRTIFFPDVDEDLLRQLARSDDHLRVLRELGLRSVIITPMIAADRVLGTLSVVTSGSRRLTTDDVNVAEDIASRAANAVQNAELYREAQEANRAKDDFLATVSHELRTPLTAILGWARLLRSEPHSPEVDEAAAAIERSAAAQAQLIEDILDVARIRVGKLQFRFGPTNVADVVIAAADTVRLSAQAKQIDFRIDIRDESIPVRGDAQRLQQVIWNLLVNAVKFTPENGWVELAAERANDAARVVVRDSGAGIAPDFLPHLFERFRQAETSQRRQYGGLGLGLSIAQYIVQAHGGSIRAESAGEGQGSTFVVELPLLADEEAGEVRSGRRPSDALESLQGISVVAVDDDPDTLQFLLRALQRAGADVRAAASVDEAVRALGERAADVIVSDIAMPDKTGYELVRAVRSTPSLAKTPILAVTASGIAGDRDRAISVGFDEYLRKPVEPHVMVAMIRNLIRR